MNNPADKPILIVDQGTGLQAPTLRAVSLAYQQQAQVVAELPLDTASAKLVIIIADVHASDFIQRQLTQVRFAGTPALVIAVEPGDIWLAPTLLTNKSGCFFCLKEWANNNLRQSNHWTAQDTLPTDRLRTSSKPLSQPVRDAFVQKLTSRLNDIEQGLGRCQDAVRIQTHALKITRHPVISYPACPVCDVRPDDSAELVALELQPRIKDNPGDFRAANSTLDLSNLKETYVDRWTGLIKHVFHSINSDLMPLYAAEAPIFHDNNIEVGYGRTETREKSELVSILEALERYSGQAARGVKNLVRGCYRDLKEHAVDPRDFVLHNHDQLDMPGFNMMAYSEDLEYNWKWGYSFRLQKPVLVPEQLVYYWLKADQIKNPINRFVYDSSNGCALGGSREEAMLYGLLEVVERDAYFTSWYARIPPRQLDLESLEDERIRTLIARSKAQGFELHVFDIRLDIDIPVVWAMIVDPSDNAPVKSYCAAGAHFDPQQAIFGALVEVTTSMGVYQKSLPQFRERAHELLHDANKVREMNDHVLLYSLPESYQRLSFLFEGDQHKYTLDELYSQQDLQMRNPDLTDDLRHCIDKVLNVATDMIAIDLNFDELEKSGLSCVKVLAPGLSPVTFGHQYRREALDRINKVSAHLDTGREFKREDLNPYPHNFP
ncbi:TOMM precursor leader peptide-binding protein [Teredinibacter waterburyi]|uniref:TOMM precursor leader peptide-binding protein n=1 Tax=Teredinibacter waterburyi TaxID=1500538 RepID=UPI00165F5BF7|nr:TOMM precursor leader peptide-binding protein [Teredinibacter waterburyi]